MFKPLHYLFYSMFDFHEKQTNKWIKGTITSEKQNMYNNELDEIKNDKVIY